MFAAVDSILSEFRPCFSRGAAFSWFCIIVYGFMLRLDHQGASSFIRWLFLDPKLYEPALHFFRAASWRLEPLMAQWLRVVINRFPVIEFNGRPLLIGDGIKAAKEACKMPAVKTLRQESNNSSKPEYIRGHHFGFVGLLVGSARKAFCCPLQGELHEGVDVLSPSEGLGGNPPTIVTRMARLVALKARQTGRCCYVTLDAYFAVGPSFLIFKETVDEIGKQLVHLITRAKDNTVGYFDWPGSTKKFREKDKHPLIDFFDCTDSFERASITTYGIDRIIDYCCVDLLWKPIKSLVRFVLVIDGKDRYILMCSDLELDPVQIVRIYSYRAKIETMFLVIKHLIGAFSYHFWTKAHPVLKRGQSLDPSALCTHQVEKMRAAVRAIEAFVNLAAITLGLLHYLSLTRGAKIWESYQGWLRTYSSDLPSEGVVQSVLQAEFFADRKVRSDGTLRLIMNRAREAPLEQAA
jgi:hypothetical protein